MTQTYTKEQLWDLYQKSPEEIKDIMFSEKMADTIYAVCEKNSIEDVSSVLQYTQNTLLGLLPPDEFQETIEKDLGFKKDIAKNIAREIYRFVFYPVKESLEKIYSIEIAPLAKMKITTPPQEKPAAQTDTDDTYREAIE